MATFVLSPGSRAWAFRRALTAVFLLAASPLLTALVPIDYMQGRWLDAHNRERATRGLAPLRWDAELARDADAWAKHLAETGRFEHSPDDPRDDDPQGENLWAGTAGAYSPDAMVGLWIAEKVNYRPGPVPNNSLSGNFEDVGHYTQVMWHTTARVGCALGHGVDDDVLVCRYAEGGNVIGEPPF